MTNAMMLNTALYSPLQLALAGGAGLAWTVMVVAVLRGIQRHGAVEIPAAAAAAVLAWATVWGLLYHTDLGRVFVGASILAGVFALSIFGYVLKNGARHVKIPEVRRYFRPGLIVSYLFWLWLLFLFVRQGNDTATGVLSGFIVSVFMSSLYVAIELSDIDPTEYSAVAAWSKFTANGCAAAFCFTTYPANHLLLSLCGITVVLDVLYVLLFRQRLRAPSSPARP
ncbi:MAG: hypothetical protein ABJB74_12750 [Gemmatimonas sp.]